jgi:hypothetical protein
MSPKQAAATVLFLLITCVSSNLYAAGVAIPDVIASFDVDAKATWISATAAVDQQGALRTELFEEHLIRRLAQMSGRPDSAGCTMSVWGPALHQAVRTDSIDGLTRSSTRIHYGKVVAHEQGFFIGTPGTLYAIQTIDAVADDSTPAITYLFLPVGEIRLKNGTICAKAHEGAVIPAIGDTIVAFIQFGAYDSAGTLFRIDPTKQLVVERDDTLHGPAAVRQLDRRRTATARDVFSAAREARERLAVDSQ